MHSWLIYVPVMLICFWLYLRHMQRRDRKHKEALAAAEASGTREPISLHPVITADLCIGSSSCVKVCPEDALGIINGKAELVNGSACIGHGACLAACPVGGISLVFGRGRSGGASTFRS